MIQYDNFYQGSSSKKELQLFNCVNNLIQNLLSRARGGTALIQSLLCNRVTCGHYSSLHQHEIEISGEKSKYFQSFRFICNKCGERRE